MLSIFNKNTFLPVAFGISAAAALWLPNFGRPPHVETLSAVMPLETPLAAWAGAHPLAAAVSAFALLLVIAVLIVKIEQTYLIAAHRLYVAPFVFVLMCSVFPPQSRLNGAYAAALLLAAALFFLFRLYKLPRARAYASIFYGGALLGGAALFYAPAVFLTLLMPVALVLFRQTFCWREHVTAFFGVAAPVFYTCVAYFFLYNDVGAFFETFYASLFTPATLIYESNYAAERIYLAYLIFLAAQTLLLFVRGLLARRPAAKKIQVLLLWASAILLGTLLLLPAGSMLLMPLLATPVSILAANYFVYAKKRRWAGLHFIILIVFSFGVRYFL